MAPPKGNQFWKLRTKHGRDKLFSTPEILWEECCNYFQSVDKRKWKKVEFHGKDAKRCLVPNETPYTKSGLFLYLDISKETWESYKSNDDFLAIITRVENIIYTQKIEGASVGAFNPSIVARELGLTDKQEVKTDVTSNGNEIDLSGLTAEERKKLLTIARGRDK